MCFAPILNSCAAATKPVGLDGRRSSSGLATVYTVLAGPETVDEKYQRELRWFRVGALYESNVYV